MPRALLLRSVVFSLVLVPCLASLLWGGNAAGDYKVLNPISHGNLSIFPVVTATTRDTSEFITLDEGIRSGEVVVTEAGRLGGLVRGPHPVIPLSSGAQVNRLVLVNNSKHPLILLAGEIVTGGKQDRIVSKDRIVPAESDPVDLGVFCVEPGRWTESSAQFSTMKSQMAQPSVRSKAWIAQDQHQVWDSVGTANRAVTAEVLGGAAAPAATSYAKTFAEGKISKAISEQAEPIEHSYSSLMKQLRDQHAVGVVVAVGGRLIWADLFASTALLEKYWPKLVRSYVAESMTTGASAGAVTVAEAQHFLEQTEGNRQTIESEPGIYRESETIAPDFRLFTLASLLPRTGFDLHISKIAESGGAISDLGRYPATPGFRR
jgi:hypothetical protein